MTRLPGLNYSSPVLIDDLSYLEDVYTEEFRTRMLAAIGSYRTEGASYGVVAETDPINATATTDPLYVERNGTDPMRVDVYPGLAVTPIGMLVHLTTAAMSVEMVLSEIGQQNVVFLEYVVVEDADTYSLTRYNTVEARRTRLAFETSVDPLAETLLRVVSLADWQNNVSFPPERRADIVPIAFVTVISSDNSLGKELSVDLSRAALPSNRPWFSVVDIQHRSEQGTGAEGVPHRLGLNDLSQGNLTLYDQLLNYGVVLGRDTDAPGVPGGLCFETITSARLETDTDGSVTGTISQPFVRLTRYPVRLLGCYSLSETTNELLVDLLPRTNLLLIHHDEIIPSAGARLLYTTVDAGEPLPDSLINNEIHFRQPSVDTELVVAGGRGHTELQPSFIDQFSNARARMSLGTAAAIPKRYRIVLDGDGQLVLTPQQLLCATRLDDIGTSAFTFETAMLGAARLRVGLQNVNLNASTVVTLRLTGTDASNNTVTEDVTFDFSNYELPVVPSLQENSRNFRVTDTVFVTVATLLVITRTADGPNTAVSVYADLDPSLTDAIRSSCPLAEVMWNGASVGRIQDIRPVTSRLTVPSSTTAIEATTQAMLGTLTAFGTTDPLEVLGDDLRDPHRFRLDDPLRYTKFSDGLRSASLPEAVGVESAGYGLEQDRYVSQALRLYPGADRKLLVTLTGRYAQRYWLNDADGVTPNLEYRWAPTSDPTDWTSWAVASPLALANGSVFRIDVTNDEAFKLQFRLKGSVVGISALQYRQLGGSQVLSGVRRYSATIAVGQTHIVSLPFGQSLANADYEININVYTETDTLPSGAPQVGILYVERFVDHAKVHLTRSVTTTDVWLIEWQLDQSRYVALTHGGFGDTVV